MNHENFDSQAYIEGFLARARKAQAEYELKSQEEVDRAVQAIARVVYQNAEMLAVMAVEETGMGNVRDKTIKNQAKAGMIWNSLRGKKSRGIIDRNPETGITKVAKPVGVVAAITPCTNPIVTPMSNAMFALKGGNAIIITPHHKAVRCSAKTVELMNGALAALGMPEHLIQILDVQSRENTKLLISSADVVVATGGAGMVHAAYSSGRPALGVGAGNVQCILDEGIDYETAVPKVILGRTFDYGIICSGEQSVICPSSEYDKIMDVFEKHGAYVVRDPEERERLRNALFDEGAPSRHSIGQSPQKIAEMAGIRLPEGTSVLVVPAEGTGEADVLGKEKMAPVLAAYAWDSFEEAVDIACRNLEAEGKGHSVALHSENRAHIEYAGCRLPVSRIVINQACAVSAGGSYFNGLAPTNTLGCGSWGHNSISENLDYIHLINISRIADFMPENHKPDETELWGSEVTK